jgi:uncharacterized protein involved in exopolysaccharide biosynthesis/Mrp family chromosome partitioning ATPase
MEGSAFTDIQRRHAPPSAGSDAGLRPGRSRPMNELRPGRSVVGTLLRRKWLVLAFALLGGVIGGLAGLARPPLYMASTQIIVDTVEGGPSTAPGTAPDPLDSVIDSHLIKLTSEAHLREVVDALHLADNQRDRTVADSATAQSSALDPLVEAIRTARSSVSRFLHAWLPQGDESSAAPPSAEAATGARLKADLRVGRELRSRIIGISFTDKDPDEAARVANMVASVYVEDLARRHRAAREQALVSLEEGLPAAQHQLASAAEALQAYRLTHGGGDAAGAGVGGQEIALLSRQASMISADLAETTRKIDTIRSLRSTGAGAAEIAEAIGSPAFSDIAARESPGAGSEGAVAEIADAGVGLPIEQAIAQLDEQARTSRTQLALLESRRNLLEVAAAETAGRLSELRSLELQVEVASRRYNDLLTRQQEVMQQILSPASGVAVWSEAWPPANPATLPSTFLIPPGMVLFGTLGAVLVVIGHNLDRTLRGKDETEQALGIPCVGVLPKPPGAKARQLSGAILTEPKSAYSRAVRSLLISLSGPGAGLSLPNAILVVSCDRQEDSTALAWSMAISASGFGERVLFLDLDPREHRLTRELRGLYSRSPARATVADFLEGGSPLAEAVDDMADIGVDYMPGPDRGCDLVPIMASADASDLIRQARSAYSVLIIHEPSGLGTSEARLAAGWADIVLLALEWRVTHQDQARNTLDAIGGSSPFERSASSFASVLTQVDLKRHARLSPH